MHGNIQLNVDKEWELMILHFGLQSEAYLTVGLLNWSDLWISLQHGVYFMRWSHQQRSSNMNCGLSRR